MKKVLLVQPILSHYRESLFELLVKDSNIDFHIIAGKELNGIRVFESKYDKIKANLTNYSIKLKKHSFYYQKGIFKYIRKFRPTDIIIGGPDYHFVSSIFLSLYLIFFTKIKIHYWTHGLSKNNSIFINNLTKFFYSKSTSIFTYAQDGKHELISKMDINEKKIVVVKNCLNDWDYGFNKKYNEIIKKPKNLNILFSGRLTKAKRVDILLKAIEKLIKDKVVVKCIIIGDGENKIELEELASNLGLKDVVEFKGALYDKDVEGYFRLSNIFVLPGKVGLSIVHALSYGLPIVTTSLPIHSPEVEILLQNENAFFFNDQSSKELAKILLSIKDKNMNELAKTCINSVLDNGYTSQSMKNKFINSL